MRSHIHAGRWLSLMLVVLVSFTLSGCVQINTQPQSITVAAGQTASFSVAAVNDNSSAITYQWYRNGNAISGATAATYSFVAHSADNGATFYVIVNDSSNKPVQSSTATLTVTSPVSLASLSLLAGSVGGPGSLNGTGSAARFFSPAGIVVDSAGNSYVADTGNHVIRRISAGGVVSTLAGNPGLSGSSDGTGSAARFHDPSGLALDAAGNLYVADTSNDTIRKITSAGVVTTLAGAAGQAGGGDGTGSAARFNAPRGIAIDTAGNLYVTDSGNDTIRMVTVAGVVTTLAGAAGQAGSSDGLGGSARFNSPAGIAIDAIGNLYVADYGNSTIRKVAAGGVVSTYAGQAGLVSSIDGTPGGFDYPEGVAVGSNGVVYVADTFGQLLRAISSSGAVTTLAGSTYVSGASDGSGSSARFASPAALAWNAASGGLLVADTGNHTVRSVSTAGVVTTAAGLAAVTGGNTSNYFNFPKGLASDSSGTVYVADQNNGAVRAVSPGGVVSTIATGFAAPGAVAIDGSSNLYITDTSAGTVTRISGNARVTILSGTSGAAGIAADGSGNVYVADTYNQVIRKINASGSASVFAGQLGSAGFINGTGTAASFSTPLGLAVDAAGDVFVADSGNRAIRKITPAGVVSTFATGLVAPQQLAVDSAGDVYVTVSSNTGVAVGQAHDVVEFGPAGGTGTIVAGHNDGTIGIGLGTLSSLVDPQGITVLPNGQLAIASWQAVLMTSGL